MSSKLLPLEYFSTKSAKSAELAESPYAEQMQRVAKARQYCLDNSTKKDLFASEPGLLKDCVEFAVMAVMPGEPLDITGFSASYGDDGDKKDGKIAISLPGTPLVVEMPVGQ